MRCQSAERHKREPKSKLLNSKLKEMKVENVIIKRVSEEKKGVSETTGKAWASRIVLIGWEDETGESYISAAVDADVWNSLGFQEGQNVSLNIKFRTKRFLNGYISNDIRIIKN